MNLRDLIFSQSSAPGYLETNFPREVDSPPFSPLPVPNRESSSDSDENEDETPAEKKKSKFLRHMGQYPMIRSKKFAPKHYRDSPEIKNSVDVKSHALMPGHDAFVKFPQANWSVLSIYRDIVRSLWNKCYYINDIEGAMMAIRVLAEIDSIGQKDLLRFAQLLNNQPDPIPVMKVLLQGSIKHKVVKKRRSERVTLITMFSELLMLHNDVSSSRMFIQGRLADSAFNSSLHLVAFDPIIVSNQIILEALSIGADLPQFRSSLPTVEDVVFQGPLAVYRSVRLLHVLCSHPTYRIKCAPLLSDIKSSFQRCNLLSSKCPWMDMHALYLAYLEGTRQHKLACKHLKRVGKMLRTAEVSPAVSDNEHQGPTKSAEEAPKTVNLKYRKLCVQHSAMFGSFTVLKSSHRVSQSDLLRESGDAVVTGALNWLRASTIDLNQTEWPSAVYVGLLLYRLKRVNQAFLVSLLSNCIEQYIHPLPGQPYASEFYRCIWRLLSALLSCHTLKTVGLTESVDASSDLAPLMTEEYESWLEKQNLTVDWREGIILGFDDDLDAETMDNDYNVDKPVEEISQEPEGEVESSKDTDSDSPMQVDEVGADVDGQKSADDSSVDDELNAFRSGCGWWRDSILSVNRLGSEFSDSVLEFEVDKSLNNQRLAATCPDLDYVLAESCEVLKEMLHVKELEKGVNWYSGAAAFNAALKDVLGDGMESGEDVSQAYDSDSSSESSVVLISPLVPEVVIKTEAVDKVEPQPLNLLQSINLMNAAAKQPDVKSPTVSSPAAAAVKGAVANSTRRVPHPRKLELEYFGDPTSADITLDLCLLFSDLIICRPAVSPSILESNDRGTVAMGRYSFLSPTYWSPGEADSMSGFHQQTTEYIVLSSEAFECLVSEVIVSSYLFSQDCLFVVKGIQVLMENLMHTEYVADEKGSVRMNVRRLLDCGINCVRAVRLASQLSQKDVSF